MSLKTIMKKKSILLLIMSGLMMMALVGGYAWAKQQVERTFNEKGYMVAFVDLSHVQDGYARWYAFSTGEATHLGKFTSYAWGVNNFAEGLNTGQGFQIAANGDKIYVETIETPEGPMGIITGGTGRFEGIEGCGGGVREIDPDSYTEQFPDMNTMIMTYRYNTTGCIKY